MGDINLELLKYAVVAVIACWIVASSIAAYFICAKKAQENRDDEAEQNRENFARKFPQFIEDAKKLRDHTFHRPPKQRQKNFTIGILGINQTIELLQRIF